MILTTNTIVLRHPYHHTKTLAAEIGYEVAASKTTTTSCSSQRDEKIRGKIWPKDIFGNINQQAQIAHLLPAGKEVNIQWIDIAAAAMGFQQDEDVGNKLKHLRGVRRVNKGETNRNKRATQTGVVHFVTNKMRLKDQAHMIDGNNPTCLIVPVLNHVQVKKWKGESYSAICLVGHVQASMQDDRREIQQKYCDTGACRGQHLDTREEYSTTRDASSEEIDLARKLLEEAIVSLQSMVSKTNDETLGTSHLLKAAKICADQRSEISLPGKINKTLQYPVCLLKFGELLEENLHPAPDPLLLVFKSAIVWGKLNNFDMLANGSPPDLNDDDDDDMLELDYFAEKWFLENCLTQQKNVDDSENKSPREVWLS